MVTFILPGYAGSSDSQGSGAKPGCGKKKTIFITFSTLATGQKASQLLYYHSTQFSVHFSCKGNIDV